MTIIVDLIIIAILALCVIIGYIRGLTGALIKIIAFVMSLVIAFVLFVPVSNFVIQNTQIDDSIERSIREIIVSQEGKSEEEKMPTAINEYISQKVEEAAKNAKEGVADIAAKEVAQTIVKAGTWIGLFIVARVALILLKLITILITKLPVIKQFDKVGGIIYGLVEGLLITYFALAMISFVTPMTKGKLSEEINKSYLGSTMYHHNLLLNIIF